jgi:hypothetical protein
LARIQKNSEKCISRDFRGIFWQILWEELGGRSNVCDVFFCDVLCFLYRCFVAFESSDCLLDRASRRCFFEPLERDQPTHRETHPSLCTTILQHASTGSLKVTKRVGLSHWPRTCATAPCLFYCSNSNDMAAPTFPAHTQTSAWFKRTCVVRLGRFDGPFIYQKVGNLFLKRPQEDPQKGLSLLLLVRF